MRMERGSFGAKRDFDALPLSPDVDVRCAQFSEIAPLSEMARRLVPGVQIGAHAGRCGRATMAGYRR